MSPLHDRGQVREEYASDAGLAARASIYRWNDGPDARELAFRAVAEGLPTRFLEVGCGQGGLLQRVRDELRATVTGLDQSEQMVDLTRARGIDAVVGDAEWLPFDDGAFDGAAAAWMLYHVPDVDRALGELARVLEPGARLVTVTNAVTHMGGLYELLGMTRPETTFSDENGEALLRRHFTSVEARPAYGLVTFPTRADAQAYVDATPTMRVTGRTIPPGDEPLRVRAAPIIFIATK